MSAMIYFIKHGKKSRKKEWMKLFNYLANIFYPVKFTFNLKKKPLVFYVMYFVNNFFKFSLQMQIL